MVPHREATRFSFNPPHGFRDGDLAEVHRVLQWLSDVAGAGTDWWRDLRDLVTVDAAIWIASDLLDRLTPPDPAHPLPDGILDRLHERRRTAVLELVGIAERQHEMGYADDADGTTDLVRALYATDVPKAYTVPLDSYTRLEDGVEIIGGRPFEFARSEVSYIVDHLRPDRISVNGFGEPRELDPLPASRYRWGRLLETSDDASTAWQQRFAENSWFRRVMQRGHDEYPSGTLGSFFT
jgi:hypothetical protein